jgi:hypothetical protein
MNMVGVLAFRKTYKEALEYHTEAVVQLAGLWRMLKDSNPATLKSESITERLAKITLARDIAQNSYDRMIHKFSNATVLLRSYASFVNDVLNDQQLANRFIAKANALTKPDDDEPDNRSAGHPSTISKSQKSGMTSQSGGSADLTGLLQIGPMASSTNFRTLDMHNKAQAAVKRMNTRLQLGTLLLLCFAIVLFITSKLELTAFADASQQLNLASNRRKLIADGMLYARDLQQLATSNSTPNTLPSPSPSPSDMNMNMMGMRYLMDMGGMSMASPSPLPTAPETFSSQANKALQSMKLLTDANLFLRWQGLYSFSSQNFLVFSLNCHFFPQSLSLQWFNHGTMIAPELSTELIHSANHTKLQIVSWIS